MKEAKMNSDELIATIVILVLYCGICYWGWAWGEFIKRQNENK